MKRYGLSVLVVLLFSGVAEARTWWVLKEGTGDFTVIQNAVDAAASGDTIRIGPGRYDEGQIYSNPGWTEFVRVMITTAELTLIGSGVETVIGQEDPWDISQGRHKGIVAATYYGNQRITIEDVTFDNLGEGIYTDEVDVVIRNCVFRAVFRSVGIMSGLSVLIEDCRFEYGARHAMHVLPFFVSEFTMRRCELLLTPYGVDGWGWYHVNLTSVANALVEQCQFFGGGVGFFAGDGGRSVVRDCTFDGQGLVGATADEASLTIESCRFRNQRRISELESSGVVLVIRDCVIEDVSEYSFWIAFARSVTVNDSDIARGTQGAVVIAERPAPVPPPTILDMTNNYWGTDNADSIRAWIRDWHDDPARPFMVEFEPFRQHSTPIQHKSLGGIRQLFHDRR